MQMNSKQSYCQSHHDNPLIWPIITLLKEQPTGWMIHTLSEELKQRGILSTLDNEPEKDLFKRNFLLMNALYQLQEMLLPEQWLQAQAMDIQLSRNLNSSNNQIAFNDPLREYYLDWKNYDADTVTIQNLLSSFWHRYQDHIGFHSSKNTTQSSSNSRHSFHTINQQDLMTLELTANAKPNEIRRQWRKLALRWHPDRPNGDAQQFRTICEAWQRIQDHLNI
jgi:hypothetical protein